MPGLNFLRIHSVNPEIPPPPPPRLHVTEIIIILLFTYSVLLLLVYFYYRNPATVYPDGVCHVWESERIPQVCQVNQATSIPQTATSGNIQWHQTRPRPFFNCSIRALFVSLSLPAAAVTQVQLWWTKLSQPTTPI